MAMAHRLQLLQAFGSARCVLGPGRGSGGRGKGEGRENTTPPNRSLLDMMRIDEILEKALQKLGFRLVG